MMSNLILFLGRLLLAHIFLLSGAQKIIAYAIVAGFLESRGISSFLLPVVIAAEILGGLALILGFMTKIGAGGLALFCVLVAVLIHNDFSQQMEIIAFQKNLAIAGGLLILMVWGPGDWAIDGRGIRRIFS